jgi:hypothetical protein
MYSILVIFQHTLEISDKTFHKKEMRWLYIIEVYLKSVLEDVSLALLIILILHGT